MAKATREKFTSIACSGQSSISSAPLDPSKKTKVKASAAPASGKSGSQYGGFGSEDIAKFGYNDKEKYGDGGAYDPYTVTQSIETKQTPYKPDIKEKIKEVEVAEIKHTLDDDSDSSLSSIDSIDSDNTKKKKKKQKKRRVKAKKE